jgi:hypothetical protein
MTTTDPGPQDAPKNDSPPAEQAAREVSEPLTYTRDDMLAYGRLCWWQSRLCSAPELEPMPAIEDRDNWHDAMAQAAAPQPATDGPALAALKRLEDACQARAGLLTPEAYNAAITADGMKEALEELDDARREARAVLAAPQPASANPWRQALDDKLLNVGLDCLAPDEEPAHAIKRLIEWETTTALDPGVSDAAQALIEQRQRDAYATGWNDRGTGKEYRAWALPQPDHVADASKMIAQPASAQPIAELDRTEGKKP